MTLALLLTAATGAWAEDTYTVTFKANGNTKTVENVTLPHTFELDPIITELYPSLSGGHGSPAGTSASGNTNVTAYNNNSKHYATISASFEGAVTVTGQFFKDFTNHQYTLEINCMEKLVAISDDKTEATIKMPQYDVTATYTLKRDMSVEMTAQVGDGTQEQPRYRVKKDGNNKFIPADMEMAAVPALFTVNDGIEQKDLTLNQDYYVKIFKIDEQTFEPISTDGVEFADFDFAPGLYAVKAVAATGSDYAGETALSNTFKLFQGYEVTVGAGEYATFYKDENLYTEDENAELYTIASVTDTEAVLSDAIKVAPAETPLLVYNKSEQDKTFLLIPTTDDADEVTPATQFVGTLEATTIPASATGADNYALNGYAFVWVKTAIEVGANKCWLHIASQPAAARAMTRSIVGGNGTTGIDAIENVTIDNEGWYDLRGRKLQAKPNRGGIYIHNGKKVIVR